MTTTCLVTGASGFMGRHLLASLTAHDHTVLALLRSPDRLPALRAEVDALGGCGDRLHALAGDPASPGLGLNGADRRQAAQAAVAFHLGAQFAWRLPVSRARTVNVEGTRQVAELAAASGSRLLMVGGFMLRNPMHLRRLGIDLERPSHTDWPAVYRRSGGYEGSKLEAHFMVTRRMRELSGALTCIHPATLCGHSRTGHILPTQPLAGLIDNLARGRLRAIPGTPAHWLPLVCVDFLTELTRLAAFDPAMKGGELLVLDDATPSLAGLVHRLAQALALEPPHRHLPLGLLRALLRVPGTAQLLRTEPESLHFIQTHRFDTTATRAFAARHGVPWPDIGAALEATARFAGSAGR